jgi:hypothetical protein
MGWVLASAGALSAAAADLPAGNRVVELPPFLVTDSRLPLHWRHAEFAQGEVLSVCSDEATRAFMGQNNRLHAELGLILPPEFQLRQSRPVTYILCSEAMRERLDRDIPGELLALQRKPVGAPPMADPRTSYRVLPNMRLTDRDAYTVFALVDEDEIAQSRLALAPDHVLELLTQRVPRLPLWFIAGFMYLYGSITLPSDPDPPVTEYVTLEPFVWISPGETSALKGAAATTAALLPLEDLFVARHPPAGLAANDRYRRAWNSEAALLIRWALEGKSAVAPQAFWNFVDRAAGGRVTPAMCQESLGLSLVQLREQLGLYLATGARHRLVLPPVAPRPPDLSLRAATDLEVARIEGGWERLETIYVKQSYPALAAAYVGHARRTLERAYERGERDPQLLAEMGLCECDAGDDAAGLPLLAAAVQARVVRPRAYFELARIRYEQARRAPAGPAGRFSVEQAASVLRPLVAAQDQDPPLLSASVLLTETWFQAPTIPTTADFGPLEQGLRFFPEVSGLAYNVALLEIRADRRIPARRIIEDSLTDPDDPNRARFLALQTSLDRAP